MFDFIPSYSYSAYFNYLILALVCIAVIQCVSVGVFRRDVSLVTTSWGFILTILLILFMGLRPVSGAFGDTVNYANGFYNIQNSSTPFNFTFGGTEWIFRNLMNFYAKYSDINMFFLTCSTIYIGALWLAMYRIFKTNYYIPLLVAFFMFTFWDYGVNGIRNGMAASIFILAITYVDKIYIMILLAFISAGIHSSAYILIAAAAISWFIKNSKLYLIGWFACIVLSLIAGERIQSYVASYGVLTGEDRITGYLTGNNIIGEGVEVVMSFRWDFLLYSFLGVFVGFYFIFRKNFKDEYYHWIYNIYLISNAFWILVIRATYSNRIAQLSWFILPLVLIYPFMKEKYWVNHEKILGGALIIFYAFTFYFNILKR